MLKRPVFNPHIYLTRISYTYKLTPNPEVVSDPELTHNPDLKSHSYHNIYIKRFDSDLISKKNLISNPNLIPDPFLHVSNQSKTDFIGFQKCQKVTLCMKILTLKMVGFMTNHKALMSSSCSTRDYSRARRMIMTHTKSTTKHLILSTNKKF